MSNCKALSSINLTPFENVKVIDNDFMYNCSMLTSINLSSFKKVETIGNHFLLACSSLTSIDLSPFKSVNKIGNGFMSLCSSLTSIDLSTLASISVIGDTTDEKEQSFLANCTSLHLIKVGSIDFTNKITVDDENHILESVENVKANKIVGSKSKEFQDRICSESNKPISI